MQKKILKLTRSKSVARFVLQKTTEEQKFVTTPPKQPEKLLGKAP